MTWDHRRPGARLLRCGHRRRGPGRGRGRRTRLPGRLDLGDRHRRRCRRPRAAASVGGPEGCDRRRDCRRPGPDPERAGHPDAVAATAASRPRRPGSGSPRARSPLRLLFRLPPLSAGLTATVVVAAAAVPAPLRLAAGLTATSVLAVAAVPAPAPLVRVRAVVVTAVAAVPSVVATATATLAGTDSGRRDRDLDLAGPGLRGRGLLRGDPDRRPRCCRRGHRGRHPGRGVLADHGRLRAADLQRSRHLGRGVAVEVV